MDKNIITILQIAIKKKINFFNIAVVHNCKRCNSTAEVIFCCAVLRILLSHTLIWGVTQ